MRFRLLRPPWRDLAGPLLAALEKADAIDASSEEKPDRTVLHGVDLEAGAWTEGVIPQKDGPTVILIRGGRKGMRRAILFIEAEDEGVGALRWNADRRTRGET